jgi:valyl-tRNA synthetase
MTLEKTYDSQPTEAKHYAAWEQNGVFGADVRSNKTPYTIMMPPPNVTGSLHMGHALTFTLQDILVRYQRMKGKDALWQPGTDHAGIATQMVVERQLAANGESRQEMGREAFLKRVWDWKAESGGTITRQLRRLGASADWPRERFTMDDGLNRAVAKVFVTLHKQGLIYKDNRLVNWDPKQLTAVSDLESIPQEVKSFMWHFRYPLADDPTKYLCIATTRPETMLGDGAVAVNPDDERYQHLIGKEVVLPLVGRRIPIIADSYADPEKGSGAVKITAAHDFNDFEVWQRHRDKDYFKRQINGGLINLFDKQARLNENCPPQYQGLDRFEARKRIVADLEALELVDKIEPLTHNVPHGERSGVVLEPMLSEQWYCDAKTLAEPAIRAVEEGKTKFVPEKWENTYYDWMRNIQPWCISRQLWWGHQIPAWYGPDDQVFVEETEEEAYKSARAHYGRDVELRRDEDVLDTWFSSALWPFSTLGWPDKTPELNRYYPTDTLVTGFDIIFFWVARMMMMGLHFMGDVPFRTIYIHALVRDEKGQKMSKTKGNVIDPLSMIDQYGCDALRFTLTALSSPGRDIKLATGRIEGYRNFATKLWNAARYAEMNGCKYDADFDPATAQLPVNRWIAGEVRSTAAALAAALDNHRFDESASLIYQFAWGTFCDWYLEFTKPILTGEDAAAKGETQAMTAWVLYQMLLMLQPFMPFLAAEISGSLSGNTGADLMTQPWPELPETLEDTAAKDEMNWLIRLITALRTVRAELNVPPAEKVALYVQGAGADTSARLAAHANLISRMARIKDIGPAPSALPQGTVQTVLNEATFLMPLADVIDLGAERARLAKESAKLADEIAKIDAKLSNESFVAKAPPEVVDENRDRRAEAANVLARLEQARAALAD